MQEKKFYQIMFGKVSVLVLASCLKSAFEACPPFMRSEQEKCSLSITFENPGVVEPVVSW